MEYDPTAIESEDDAPESYEPQAEETVEHDSDTETENDDGDYDGDDN